MSTQTTLWSNLRAGKALRINKLRSNKRKTSKAKGFSTWSNMGTSQALIIMGCFLLAWMVGYRIGYRSGIRRLKRETPTVPPSSVEIVDMTTEAPSSPEVVVATQPDVAAETQPAVAMAAQPETGHTNGRRATTSPTLSEEFGTQQLFSNIAPYVRKIFYYVE